MSHRSIGSDPTPGSAKDRSGQEPRALEPSLAPNSLGQPSSPRAYRQDIPRSQEFALPPLQQLSPRSEQRAHRPFGVHSILNPPAGEASAPHGQRRSATHLDYDAPQQSSSVAPREWEGRPSSIGNSEDLGGRGTYLVPLDTSYRRVLTPRSPASRAASAGRARAATAGNNPVQSPYTACGPHSAGPEYNAAGAALSGGPSASLTHGYNLPPVEVPQGYPARHRLSGGVVPQVSSSEEGSSASFSPSQHSLTSLTSPSGPLAQFSVTSNPFGTQQGGQGYGSAPPALYGSERQYGIPIATTGQSSIQLMTYETDRGPVQLPVDVQAGSRMADEKRKRNAGASARFRARRKEKEKEASSTIAKLEQQLRELAEDGDFYKRERDYFAGIVYNTPGGDRHFPRPPSPRLRRSAQTQAQPTTYGAEASGSYGHYGERGERRESERPVRRRMPGYELPPPSQLGVAPSHEAPPFAQSAQFPGPPPPPPAHNQPGPARGPGSSGLPLPPPPPPPPRGATYDPFAPSRYERSWPPSASGDQR